jgi:hypothetical protein
MSKNLRAKGKHVLIAIITIVSVLIVGISLFFSSIFPPPISQNAMTKDFMKHKKEILLITEYMKKSPYAGLYINNSYTHKRGEIFISSNETKERYVTVTMNK